MDTATPARPWRTALPAGMASFLDSSALVSAGIVVGTLYPDAMSLSDGQIGVILGVQTLSFALGALVGGRLGDRFGRRRVFTWSLAAYALGALLLAVAAGPALLVVGAAVIGSAIGADLPVSLAMINEEAPEGRKATLVVFSSVLWNVGIAVTMLLSALLSGFGATGGRVLFGYLVVVALVVLGVRLTVRESAEWRRARDAADAGESVRFRDLPQLLRPPLVLGLLATALYYAMWNVGANTMGQFGSFLYVNVGGGEVATYSLVSTIGLGVGLVAGVVFMRYVDTAARRPLFAAGSAVIVLAWVFPLVVGFSEFSLLATLLLSGLGSAFAGETLYKVWSQELFPTLLRTTAQGCTIAFGRIVAALAGFATPAAASASAGGTFAGVAVLALIAAGIGLLWIPRLPGARQLTSVDENAT
ncbi:MFS transporter [Saccharopolyspora flava]|uniref:MFS transporter, SP family, inositol transporter n=1 Tax=Saccharopolyspora flava TaxID=95161 RepID=A0A1I6S0T0_9PSEU|nr:MFS transporter [Saccharopolyspora flava]SFS70460.1 MFS transporter, SP family, inositol transporter [Saccharopolyspora flava]